MSRCDRSAFISTNTSVWGAPDRRHEIALPQRFCPLQDPLHPLSLPPDCDRVPRWHVSWRPWDPSTVAACSLPQAGQAGPMSENIKRTMPVPPPSPRSIQQACAHSHALAGIAEMGAALLASPVLPPTPHAPATLQPPKAMKPKGHRKPGLPPSPTWAQSRRLAVHLWRTGSCVRARASRRVL
jgi:hypothetical protein